MNVSSTRRSAIAGCLAGLMLCGAMGAMPADSAVSANVLAPGVAQAKTSGSIVRNGMFAISAGDFIDNMNKNYGRLSDCDLSVDYDLTSNGVTMQLTIKDGSKKVGKGAFYDASDNALALYMLGSDNAFNDVIIFFDEYNSKRSEYVANTMKAVILTADPTLSAKQVQALALDWIDSVEDISKSESIGSVTKNGITYTLASSDDEDFWAIDVEVE